ncbi:DNA polymerase III subunit gamma/tau [Photobacterium profundum]|uniref:DNA polymerase III subunit gamma/tau n=1 Tax=Photobacterium profundum 3TCK TaxID=314280 RepID=Q1Z5S3_9GAMM|nr:DNA polymerase III subunit gamma/tau [Photobacterium profundum]EAS43809.1 DNA polymerase III subunits gamma and tau [Photobacterium profundum 3TCK]PSV64487.1 DNA polymerase III subunit gamma/tau [Photobacterium profundum]
MSYQVLARKWRPHQFSDVVGQSHVLTALSNALAHNRLHHAYLFSGTRGVGKTTIARIFAKGLNCEQGVTATPCGQCGTCKEIDEGRFVDLLEIDAASRTKVEDTRELLDNVQYKPARGRFKVYLIDEVHMLSRHSFNALLKTLEEPPEYVKFILATTDPQKLPVTILSRCLQFHLKHLDNNQIQSQLSNVLTQENVDFEPKALSLLSRAAEGSMRDALSLTDQAIALGNGQVHADSVSMMLGTLNTDQALFLLEAVSGGQANTAMGGLEELASVGVEWDSLLRELSAQLHRVAMHQALPAALDMSAPDADRIITLSSAMTPQDVQLCYQIALQGRQDLAFAPDGRIGLEMVLLRMLAFRPVSGSGITPQSINVPASEPAAQTMPSGRAPNAPQQGMQRVQALKAQMGSQPQAAIPQVTAPHAAVPQAVTSQHGDQHLAASPSSIQESAGTVPAEQHQQYQQQVPTSQAPSRQEPTPPPAQYQQQTPHSEQSAASQNIPPAQPRSAASGLLAARNKLRSQSKRGNEEHPVKKGEPAPAKKVATNVLDRIANKHAGMRVPTTGNTATNSAMPASMIATQANGTQANVPEKKDEYQWKPLQQVVPEEDTKLEVAPRKLKQALEHEKTPEMAKLLVKEAANQDSWSDLVTKLNVGRLVQQLALNSAFEQDNNQVTLYLRQSQSHLDNPKAREQLAQAIGELQSVDIDLKIELSGKGQTPLEWREGLYQQKLGRAKESLESDANVTFIRQRFAAVLDEDSIRPL